MGVLATTFNELTSKSDQQPSDKALLDALCLAISSDDDVGDEEYEQVVDLAMELDKFRDGDRKSVEKALKRCFERLDDDGDVEESLERIASEVPDKHGRRLVFHLMALVQELDGEVNDDEDDLLSLAARVFKISEKHVEKIFEEVAEALARGDSGGEGNRERDGEGDGEGDREGDDDEGEPEAAEVPMRRVWPDECKTCGAKIEMPSAEADTVTCTYCATKYPVELQPVAPS